MVIYMDFFSFRTDFASKLQIHLSDCLFDISTCMSQKDLTSNSSWFSLYSQFPKLLFLHIFPISGDGTSRMLSPRSLEVILDVYFASSPHRTQSRLCQFHFQNTTQVHPHVSILPASILMHTTIIVRFDSWYSEQMVPHIPLTLLP